jgi:multidrug efflux pump subunit AcrA (membrane-fusion protein)
MMSEVLDDERKEAFLQALHGLKEEQVNTAAREKELQERQQEQLEEQRRAQEEEQRVAEARRAEEEARRREETRKYPQRPPDAPTSDTNAGAAVHTSKMRPAPTSPTGGRPRPSGAIPSKKNTVSRHRPSTPQSPQTFYKRAAALFSNLQTLVLNMGQGLVSNPMALMRMLLFVLMFALAFGRRDIRERVKRIVGKAWDKVAATVGMGTKVSYI